MNVIVGGRGSGKTFRLVEWYNKDPTTRRIITRDYQSARRLIDDYGVDKKHVFTFEDRNRLIGQNGQFGVDDGAAEAILTRMLGFDGVRQRLGPVTINGAAMDASSGEVVTRAVNNPYVPREQLGGEWEDA